MPYCGPGHFYGGIQKKTQAKVVCQCPIAGHGISTKKCTTTTLRSSACVNALLRARSFLPQGDTIEWEVPIVCQCPIAGQVISTRSCSVNVTASGCVNAPIAGHGISTAIISDFFAMLNVVSIPYCGPSHFYMDTFTALLFILTNLCQCPIAGQVISTRFSCTFCKLILCVNALLRARSFLQGLALLMLLQVDVSMPYCGPSHFYERNYKYGKYILTECVNALLRAKSFLPHSPESQYLCGSQRLFLHVFF